MSYIKKRGDSFGFAFQGLQAAGKEPNFRIQISMAVLVIIFGLYCGISRTEWCLVIGCCAMVLILELLNSAIEKLCDHVSTEINPTVKFIKDVCAGAVLIASIASALIGLIIFAPYLKSFFS